MQPSDTSPWEGMLSQAVGAKTGDALRVGVCVCPGTASLQCPRQSLVGFDVTAIEGAEVSASLDASAAGRGRHQGNPWR